MLLIDSWVLQARHFPKLISITIDHQRSMYQISQTVIPRMLSIRGELLATRLLQFTILQQSFDNYCRYWPLEPFLLSQQ